MPTQDQLMQFPFIAGMDQKPDPKLVNPPTLSNMVNGYFAKDGRIQKRFGTSQETGFYSGRRLAKRGDEQLIVEPETISTFISGTGRGATDACPAGYCWRDFVASDTLGVCDGDIAYNATAGVYVIVWRVGVPFNTGASSGSIYVKCVDATTGATTYGPVQIADGLVNPYYLPKVVCIGNNAVVTYLQTGANLLLARRLPGAAGPVSAEQTLRNDLRTSAYDVSVQSDRFVVGYEATGAAPSGRIYTYAPGAVPFVQLGTVTLAGEAATGFTAIACYADTLNIDDKIYYAYSSGSAVKAFVCNATTLAIEWGPLTVFAAGTADPFLIGLGSTNGGSAAIVCSNNTATTTPAMLSGCITSVGGIFNSGKTWNVVPASKPFASPTGSFCVWAWNVSAEQGGYFLCAFDAFTLVANTPAAPRAVVAPRLASGKRASVWAVDFCHLGNVAINGTKYSAMLNVSESSDATKAYSLERVHFDYSTDYNMSFAEREGATHFCGGMATTWDGIKLSEMSFCWYPEGSVASNGGGGVMAAGTYSYRFVYEYTDALGVVHQSAPSAAYQVVCVANDKVNITVKALNLTNRQDDASQLLVVVYRTTVGGSIYYRLSVDEGYNIILNSKTSRTVTLTDNRTDASIDGAGLLLNTRPQIYTTGGSNEPLENVCPPSAGLICVHKDRIWLARTDDTQAVWLSNRLVQGEGPNFNESNAFRVSQAVGGITAIAALDDKLILWSADACFVVYADGPNELGQGSDLSDPVKLPFNIGCISPRSVALIPDGLIFRSRIGFYILTRSLDVVYIGAAIEDLSATYPTVTSAVCVPSLNQVRFTCHAGSTTGVSLVFDYRQKLWYSFQHYDTGASVSSCAIYDAIVTAGVYRFVTRSGYLFSESSSTYKDGGSQWVTLTIETAWIKPAGLVGYARTKRFQVLGQRLTDSNLSLGYAINYVDSYLQNFSYTAYASDFLGTNVIQYEIGPKYQRIESIKIRIQDATPSGGTVGTGQGAALTGVALRVGVKQGTFKLPALQRS